MIRSTKVSTKFCNTNRLNKIDDFILEFKNVVIKFIDILWKEADIPRMIPKEYTDQIKEKTWLSARAIQSAAKQASGIVRGTKEKNKKRLYIYNKLNNEGKFKKARNLLRIIEKNKESQPVIKTLCPELDSRFVKMDFDSQTSFDGWVTLSSFGNKIKIKIPFKKTKHFNELMGKGNIKTGIRLSKKNMSFSFVIPDPPIKDKGKVVGIDVGIKKVFVSSDNQLSKKDKDGWNLGKIQEKLSRKKKGSKGFGKTQNHRENFINWSLNQLNLSNVKEIRLEKIKHLRKGKRNSRFMSHWTYTSIFDKLKSLCEEAGVQITKTASAYTSQRCSQCGWVRKNNRKGEQFKCTSCGFAADADLNASFNISLDLPAISRKKRLSRINRKGFYWNEISKECIVPCA